MDLKTKETFDDFEINVEHTGGSAVHSSLMLFQKLKERRRLL